MIIYEKHTEDVYTLSIYKYKIVNNVIKYSYQDFDKWVIDTHNSSTEGRPYFLIIDTLYHEAFGHWVYESAIYLLLFLELKLKYPTIKLHLQGHKEYKRLFCEHFGISKNDIVLTLPSNNICIFPLPITAHSKRTICDDYMAQVDAFCKHIQSSISTIQVKHINTLLMPRQKKENYAGNDREYNIEDISKSIKDEPSTMILNTDTIKTLQEQIELVSSSKNIVLTGGAPYFVNGIISENANIVVLGASHHTAHIREYVKIKYIDYIIQLRNTVINIAHSDAFIYSDIKEYLE